MSRRRSRRTRDLPTSKRERQLAAIERHIKTHGFKTEEWTPTNGVKWSFSNELNWIEKHDPAYTYRVERRAPTAGRS